MKKFILFICMLCLVISGAAFAANSAITDTNVKLAYNIRLCTFTWLSDDGDGSIPATDSDERIDGYVFLVVTDPGATAPTADYDLTLKDSEGCDIMGGGLTDLSATVSEQAIPTIGTAEYGERYVHGPITLTGAAAGNAKIGTVLIYYRTPSRFGR